MRTSVPISEESTAELFALMNQVKSLDEFKRIQCVWLRAVLHLSPNDIASAVGLKPTTVKQIQSRYLREGAQAFYGTGRGGRRHQNLAIEEESQFISSFVEKSKRGDVVVVNDIKVAYEERIGRSVPKSTVYRILARHGWRKITPRPRHLKSNSEKQEEFKKTSV